MTIIETDNAAPHQIRIFTDAGMRICVGCTCRGTGHSWHAFVSFGLPSTTREAKALYNDLSNHDQSRAPFTSAHLLEEQ